MRVHVPLLWDKAASVDYRADTIEMALIVPRAGECRRVYLDKYQAIDEGQEITCIWTPPYTEVDGWMEQPSEIALGYVITGTAHLPVKPTDGDDGRDADYTTGDFTGRTPQAQVFMARLRQCVVGARG